MRSAIKIVLLLILLMLPLGIFIFLYSFGSNEFEVAIQHPNGLKIEGCDNNSAPHQYPVIDSLGLAGGNYRLFYIPNSTLTKDDLNALRRLSNNNPEIWFNIYLKNSEDSARAENYEENNWRIFVVNNPAVEELNRCIFGNNGNLTLILTDPLRRIRGYYDIKKIKELDRLEGEIKILTE